MRNLPARFTTLLALALAACGGGGGDDGPPPDPSGTVTTSVNYTANATPIELYYALADDGPYDRSGTMYPYVSINMGMNPSINFMFHTGISQAAGTYANPIWFGLGTFGGEVADIGAVGGLGAVTEKPSSGYSTATAVQVGHGYVARYKRSKDYATANVPYVYARVYVDEWLLHPVTGGIIGAKFRYQSPF